jgi:hypothetical protein
MKAGLSLTELAQEIERRAAAKADYIAPTGKIELVAAGPKTQLVVACNGGDKQFDINRVAHQQIAEYAGIPKPYYDRMLTDAPGLLATNVNRWVHDQGKSKDARRVRVLDNYARAFLSDKYRTLDNEDLAEAVLPVLLDMDLMILSSQITETRMYIKAVSRTIERDIPAGKKMGDGGHTIFDTVSPGIVISNSEVGHGALSIETSIFTRACTNLALFGSPLRKYHTGTRAELSDEVYALLSDKTRKVTDAALWAQVNDVVRGAFDEARFTANTDKLRAAGEDKLEGNVVEVVETFGKKFNVNEGERKGILQRLIEGGDLSRYGLHSAVTRFSADVEDYDRATEFERMGGQIIELPKSQWQEVLKAAA